MPGQNLTRAEATERAAVVTTHSYEIALDLTQGAETFRSTSRVRFSGTPGSATFIDLVAPRVESVTLNGRELDVAEVFADSRIALADLAADNELVVVADCAYMNTGEGLHRFVDPVDGEVYLYSQFEVPDSRRVFAVFEQPDLKAVFQFRVVAPDHWTVVSNARVADVDPHGEGARIWRFEDTDVISSYITAIIAGPYTGGEGTIRSIDGREIPAKVLCRASLAEHLDVDNILELTQQGFTFYENAFGMPYPFTKYDQLFVPEFNAGAMENAGAVTFLERYVFRSKVTGAMIERRAITILHELAHMWFGDLVTMRWWNDLWLNESFAEYASTLAAAEATRFTGAWTTFNSLEKSWAYRQDQLPSTHPIVATINDLEDVQVNFDGITYAKGASVLRQLVAWVGAEEFLTGVAAYFRKHAHGNTELRDLLVELEAASGRELASWSALWLETAGVNTLSPEIAVDAEGTITSFAVRQTAPAEWPTLRPHRLGIGFYDVDDAEGGPVLRRVRYEEVDVDGELTEIPALTGTARPDLVLLNDDDLAYAKIRLDSASLETALRHLRDFADSLPRALVWSAAWDMTRDGEWPAQSFVDLALGNIDAETDSTVIMMLLRQLVTSLDAYVDPAARDAATVAAAERLWELLGSAEAGGSAVPAGQGLRAARPHAGAARPAGRPALGRDRGRRAGDQRRPGLGAAHRARLGGGGRAGRARGGSRGRQHGHGCPGVRAGQGRTAGAGGQGGDLVGGPRLRRAAERRAGRDDRRVHPQPRLLAAGAVRPALLRRARAGVGGQDERDGAEHRRRAVPERAGRHRRLLRGGRARAHRGVPRAAR